MMLHGAAVPSQSLPRLLYLNVLKPRGLVRPRVVVEDPAPHRFAQLVGGVFLLAASWAGGELGAFHPRNVSGASIAALAYLIAFGSIAAFSAYAWLMQVAPAWRVGTHAYVNPVVAVGIGSLFGGEPLTAALIASTAVIAGGVALILMDQVPEGQLSARPSWRMTAVPAEPVNGRV
jgi:drug/metabolite transporter (DMT)-like permease